MNTSGPYTVRAYATIDTARGCDYNTECDTLADARKRARHCLTREFADLGEMSAPFVRATVTSAAGECVEDYTGKPTKEHTEAARKLARIAYNGLYSVNRDGLNCLRWNDARAVAGGIELRDAYSAERGDWQPLGSGMRLHDCNGRPVVNPLASSPAP